LRKSVEASWAFSAEATFLALYMMTLKPQYGQVLVFSPALASKNPPHLLHTIIRTDFMVHALRKPFPHSAK
jgi:hypothetical protein